MISQNTKIDTVQIELPKLIVQDSSFIKSLSSLVISERLSLKRNIYYEYSLFFKKDSCDHYTLVIGFVPPYIWDNDKNYGAFKLNNFMYIISGDVPPGLFYRSSDTISLFYELLLINRLGVFVPIQYPEEHPIWIYSYINGKLELLHSYWDKE